MFFIPIIERFGVTDLAEAIGLPSKNVRRWVDLDSIPAEWFAAVARAARRRGVDGVTVAHLADVAERRRLSRAEAA
ncbi:MULTISPECIES: carph-isopro domain-containing protein [unclassified Brevundimonas]|uniref:carph-isopro domain-containing protein n=1 Tax=unclassified Brevundimonas TaxID=2622653 RepID=UPI0014302D19|nr:MULTISPECIES: hypothetical protein [unclassified Brevundimonas]